MLRETKEKRARTDKVLNTNTVEGVNNQHYLLGLAVVGVVDFN